ncbi:hypothetical protein VaNZ11_001524 [Volvox africanus]|uniref:receptor protein-tyrosine kinase n=1 Tax=Volvox africanus TaxID=51714 RepID=A0ABQ5RPV6_9CHLO|nr:hypothetical protein VaNZ11_001524 [Volvox africanus]
MQITIELSHFRYIVSIFVFFGISLTQPAAAQSDLETNVLDFCGNWTFGTANACEFYDTQSIPYLEDRRFYFPIPPGASYDLIVTVWIYSGDVDAELLAPNGTELSSSSERIGNEVVTATRAVLSRNPGNYTLVLRAVAQAMSTYGMMIWTPNTEVVTRLALEDKAALSSIASDCCPNDDDILPDSCTTLLLATARDATDEDDICRKPPNTCDENGHLTKLFLSASDSGNFVCSSFPISLGQLSKLKVLDWTGNNQIGTLAEVAKVLSPLNSTLERLYLGRNALSGPLGCELVNVGRLEILKLEGNMLNGTVPSCLLKSPTLKQLSLASNLLEGTIPSLSDCKLVMLDLSANGPTLGVPTSKRGLEGTLPSLVQAVNLAYLNVQSNSLIGTIPTLPPQLQVLQAAYNHLTGSLRLDGVPDLRVLDLSYNELIGTLPPSVASSKLLTVLRVTGNQLSGVLPNGNWGSYLMEVDLSANNFTGQDLGFLTKPSLIKLNLASNNFSFDIKALASKLPENNSMLYFNISHNSIYGQLTEQLGRMQLFKKLMQNALEDDETLQISVPPQPLFDISYNQINSTFPLKLLPLLGNLYGDTPDADTPYIPLSFVLQPQTPPNFISCPSGDTEFLTAVIYLSDLEQLFDLTCMTQADQRVNISAFQTVFLSPAPPKPRLPPRPPLPVPPRPPIPGRSANSTSSSGSVPTPAQGLPSGSASSRGPGGNSDVSVGKSTVGELSSPPSAGAAADAAGSSGGGGGGSKGAIAGGVVGGLLLAIAVAVITLYFVRRNRTHRGARASRRTPLTFNSAYEAPSEATASNYGDMQMFEFNPLGRDPANRSRIG